MAQSGKFRVIGSTGLRQQSGIILEELNSELRGQRGRQTIQQMVDTDPVISGTLFAIDMLIRRAKWTVQPFDESEQAVADADFVNENIHDMSASWEDTISEILTMLPHGFSLFEILYKQRVGPDETNSVKRSQYSDGRIGWRKFSPRAQETIYRWEFDGEGGIAGVWQLGYMQVEPVFIPIEKLLLFRTTTQKGNPEGTSVLRSAYASYYYQNALQRIEAIGIERDLAGLPVMRIPPEFMADDAEDWQTQVYHDCQRLVTSIRRDEQEGVIIPQQFDDNNNPQFTLELLSTGGSRQFDVDKIIVRYDQRKAMALLSDFILLGHQAVGTQSLADVKVNLFMSALKAWLDAIAGVINQHAIPRLFRLNGMHTNELPEVIASDVREKDTSEIVEAVSNLARVGMIGPSDELERYLLEQMGLPYQEPDERLVPDYLGTETTPRPGQPQETPDESSEQSDDPEDND